MTTQVFPSAAQRWSRRSHADRADYTCDRQHSSCSRSPPPPRFHGTNGSAREPPCPSTDAKPSRDRLLSARSKSTCPACLGHHPHDVNNCTIQYLWDGSPAYTRRAPDGRLIDPTGDILCHDWQKPQGCSRPHNSSKHACSGCSSTSHSAQKCPKVQLRNGNDAV